MPKVIHNQHKVNQRYAGTQITTFRCTKCDYQESVNQWTRKNLHCPQCALAGFHTALVKSDVIERNRADEIRSRQSVREPDEPLEDTAPMNPWDEGLVQPRRSILRSIGAGKPLEVTINRNRESWEAKVIHINGEPYYLNDLGAALKGVL